MMTAMSYPPDHKAKTHARIIESAARSFRENGMLATGIDQLMADAGLTRGGFYAHFASKAALFAEVVRQTFVESTSNLFSRGLDKVRGPAWIVAATQRYLTAKHRDRPAEGCGIPALGAEIARSPDEVREAFGAEIEALLGLLAERGGMTHDEATTLLATWVGGLTIARGVADPAQSEAVLAACRAEIARRFGADPSPASARAVTPSNDQ